MGEITYYFIRNAHEFKIFNNSINKNGINLEKSAVILWDSSFAPFFARKNIDLIFFSHYAKKIDFNFVSMNVLKLINNFPHIKILNDKSLVQLLEYNGYSLWWFLRQGFYSHCTRAIKEIYTLRLLFNERKVSKVAVFDYDVEFLEIVKEAAKGSKILIKSCESNAIGFDYFENKKRLFLNLMPRLIRVSQGFFRSFGAGKSKNKFNILFFTKSDVWSNVTESIRGDTTFHTVLRYMQKSGNYNVIPLDVAINTPAAWKAIKEKKKPFLPIEYFIFRSFFNHKTQKTIYMQKIKFKRLWRMLDKESSLKDVLVSNKIRLYPFLRSQIKSYFFGNFDSLAGAARSIEVGRKLIDDYRIDATICSDENGNSRFLVFASKMQNVPSIALQHGLITPLLNVSYFYSRNDVHGYKKSLNCQFPDRTAVYGIRPKNMLMKIGKYAASQIVVTGQPRTDVFFENKGKYSKARICGKLGINPGKKLIVFASQPLDELSESKITLTAVIESVRNLKDAKLVVKLHPGDNEQYYKRIIDDLRYDAVAIKDIDLYELLYCSELVISIQSTVILEALMLDKPVIKINLIENYNLFGGVVPQGIIEVFKEEGLPKVIDKILSDKAYMEKIKKKRKKMISEYFYKIDGNSTKRFVKVLDGMLKRKTDEVK